MSKSKNFFLRILLTRKEKYRYALVAGGKSIFISCKIIGKKNLEKGN